MAFVNTNTAGGSGSDVDWDGMNAHVVEVVGTQNKKKSVVGIISGIYELGIQAQEDAKMEWNGTPAQEAAELEKAKANGQSTYFEDMHDYQSNSMKRFKRWKNKAVPSVAFTVDFPQYMVDKGKFFGESNPSPLRMIMNGEFTPKGSKEKGLGRIYGMGWTKLKTDEWSLKPNSIPYKLGVYTDVINDTFPFMPEDIPKLLGKACQFEIQLHVVDGFLREKIKLQGVIPEGLPIPELDPKYLHTVEFDVQNDPEAIKQLRVSVINTIKKAQNYEGNAIQAQIEANAKPTHSSSEASSGGVANGSEQKAPVAPPKLAESTPTAADSDMGNLEGWDSDIPF